MKYDSVNLYTAATAESIPVGSFGYFANNMQSLEEAIAHSRGNSKCYYGRLRAVLAKKWEKRFDCQAGSFIMFYYIGDNYEAKLR